MGVKRGQCVIGNTQSKISPHRERSISTATGKRDNLCMWFWHDNGPAHFTHAASDHLNPAFMTARLGHGRQHHLATKIPWPGSFGLLFLGSPQESNLWDVCGSRRWYSSYNFSSTRKYSTFQGSLTQCITTWLITSMPIKELVATSLNASCELIETDITQNSAHTVQPINIMKMKWKI